MLLLRGPHLTLDSKGLGSSTFFWPSGTSAVVKPGSDLTIFLPKPDSLSPWILIDFCHCEFTTRRVIWVSFFSFRVPHQLWVSSVVSPTISLSLINYFGCTGSLLPHECLSLLAESRAYSLVVVCGLLNAVVGKPPISCCRAQISICSRKLGSCDTWS